jgi:hypothetical protein
MGKEGGGCPDKQIEQNQFKIKDSSTATSTRARQTKNAVDPPLVPMFFFPTDSGKISLFYPKSATNI